MLTCMCQSMCICENYKNSEISEVFRIKVNKFVKLWGLSSRFDTRTHQEHELAVHSIEQKFTT